MENQPKCTRIGLNNSLVDLMTQPTRPVARECRLMHQAAARISVCALDAENEALWFSGSLPRSEVYEMIISRDAPSLVSEFCLDCRCDAMREAVPTASLDVAVPIRSGIERTLGQRGDPIDNHVVVPQVTREPVLHYRLVEQRMARQEPLNPLGHTILHEMFSRASNAQAKRLVCQPA